MHTLKHITLLGASIMTLLLCLTSCGDGEYKKIDGKICWTVHTFSFGLISDPLDADTLTFEALKYHYGKDKDHAFYEDSLLPYADAATFEALKKNYARDAKHAYYKCSIIRSADPATFKVVNENLSYDANDYFWKSTPFRVYDPDHFKIFYEYADEANWARDSKYGYYMDVKGIVTKFHITNYKDFEPITYKDDGTTIKSCHYATDGTRIYSRGIILKSADPETFVQTDFDWAHDKNTYYYRGELTDSIPPKK